MRLIDADALLKDGIRVTQGLNEDGLLYIPMRDVTKSIKKAPTVDAVPVVRCKDCRNYSNVDAHKGKILDFRWCNKFGNITKEDDFCSYGERKKR